MFRTALVGMAGAFIGLHISVILGLLPSPLMHYILAAFGAVIVLWLWRDADIASVRWGIIVHWFGNGECPGLVASVAVRRTSVGIAGVVYTFNAKLLEVPWIRWALEAA